MQTEFPRNVLPPEQTSPAAIAVGAMSSARNCAAATSNVLTPALTDDDLALIDLRYHQFMALAELDQLMEEL